MEQNSMNTKIEFLYRDASNYKVWNSVTVSGKFTEEQERQIQDSLVSGEDFIPEQVGLPARRFDSITEDDLPWMEFRGLSLVTAPPTIEMDISTLVENFRKAAGNWNERIHF